MSGEARRQPQAEPRAQAELGESGNPGGDKAGSQKRAGFKAVPEADGEQRGGYLEKLNVVPHGGELVQFRLVRFQLGDLRPHLFQELLGQIDGALFLGFHQFSHLEALQLDRPDQFRKDGVAVLGGRTSRTLERAKRGKIWRVSVSWSLWTAKHRTKERLKSSQEIRPSCGLFCVWLKRIYLR